MAARALLSLPFPTQSDPLSVTKLGKFAPFIPWRGVGKKLQNFLVGDVHNSKQLHQCLLSEIQIISWVKIHPRALTVIERATNLNGMQMKATDRQTESLASH